MNAPLKLTSKKLIDIKKDLTHINPTKLGNEGGFGVVHKGKFHQRHHGKETVIDCAIKTITTKTDFAESFNLFYREITTQDLIKHDAILPLLGFYIPFYGVGKLTLVTPLMKNGSLRTVLSNEKTGQAEIDWSDIKKTITAIGVAAGLFCMHKENLVHRDIKPENILLDDDFHPKICDFGFSKIFEEGLEEMISRTNCGTKTYMAPEQLFGDGKYNSKVDVYSYGLVLYELFYNKSFYDDFAKDKKDKNNYLIALTNGYRPDMSKDETVAPFYRELITKCWDQDPNARPSFKEILESILEAYKNGEIERDSEIDDYIDVNVECLGFDVSFLNS